MSVSTTSLSNSCDKDVVLNVTYFGGPEPGGNVTFSQSLFLAAGETKIVDWNSWNILMGVGECPFHSVLMVANTQ
jgi:hypothetical protein